MVGQINYLLKRWNKILIIYKVMLKKISEQDRNAAYPSISIGGVNKKTNLCGGILGIIFLIILITLLIQKSIIVFGKK